MNTMLAKEKPDLLFNNPLKQKVYVFLKNNPGKDFEAFQVLTGDSAVSRQHFNEVEQAIRAREERDRTRGVARDVHALFLQGAIGGRPRLGTSDSPEEKERILKKIEKKKLNEKAKQYIKEHPACTYEELVKALEFQELSKPHFFSMKTQLRKKGLISEESRTRRGRKPGKPGEKRQAAPVRENRPAATSTLSTSKTVEILETIAAGGFSDEVREHYKSHVLPLLRKLVPGGENLQLVFLSDPPTMELRRGVS
jgi:hypothetical protein